MASSLMYYDGMKKLWANSPAGFEMQQEISLYLRLCDNLKNIDKMLGPSKNW